MAAEEQIKQIGRYRYKVMPMPTARARQLWFRLVKHCGAGLPALLGSTPGKTLQERVEAALAVGASAILGGMELDDFEWICNRCLTDEVKFEAGPDKWPSLEKTSDVVFKGHIDEMLAVIAFVIKVNFESFTDGASPFGSLLKRGSAAGAATATSASPSPTESTG